jgi:polyisoprenoid-binding protein YceI
MKPTRTLILTILGVAFIAAPILAAETMLTFDPSSTEIHWTLDTLVHTVHGTFQLKSGAVAFDPATGKASGQLVVSSASGESGNGSRDARMHKSILESPKFPDIVFSPDRVDGKVPAQGSATIQIHGIFRLNGVNHELTLPVQANVEPARISATTKFSIPYIQWGLKNPSTFILRVSDKVEIDIHAVGRVRSTSN